jgi:hypothetical protein
MKEKLVAWRLKEGSKGDVSQIGICRVDNRLA